MSPSPDDPAVVAMLDQLQASDNELLQFIRGAGPDITVRTITDPGPVVGAVIDRMKQATAANLNVCLHLATDITTWCWWYAHQPDRWGCADCHGVVTEPAVCDACGGPFDTRHAHLVYVSAHRQPPSVTPPIGAVMSLCSRCTADNDEDLDDAEAPQ